MQEEHKSIVDQYKQNEKTIEKSQRKPLAILILMVGTVVAMKAIQTTASLTLNIIASSFVLILLCLHFWDFHSRRKLYEKSTHLVLKGLGLEKENPFSGLSFFKDHLKKFSVLGEIVKMAIFDLMLLYFFSVSYTQLIKAINPEILEKLRPITPISTAAINLFLGLAYYQAIKPLVQVRRELEGSWA
ncbi:MAG TPA: hypothetical protein VHA52_05930 [Candidatus Babeliaceae bacterium]|nr:hypothetical protein [Candidatus Babeliaceae bacterium]